MNIEPRTMVCNQERIRRSIERGFADEDRGAKKAEYASACAACGMVIQVGEVVVYNPPIHARPSCAGKEDSHAR